MFPTQPRQFGVDAGYSICDSHADAHDERCCNSKHGRFGAREADSAPDHSRSDGTLGRPHHRRSTLLATQQAYLETVEKKDGREGRQAARLIVFAAQQPRFRDRDCHVTLAALATCERAHLVPVSLVLCVVRPILRIVVRRRTDGEDSDNKNVQRRVLHHALRTT